MRGYLFCALAAFLFFPGFSFGSDDAPAFRDALVTVIHKSVGRRGAVAWGKPRQGFFVSEDGHFLVAYAAIKESLSDRADREAHSVSIPAFSAEKKSGYVAQYRGTERTFRIVSHPKAPQNAEDLLTMLSTRLDMVVAKMDLRQGEKVAFLPVSPPRTFPGDYKGQVKAAYEKVKVPHFAGERFVAPQVHAALVRATDQPTEAVGFIPLPDKTVRPFPPGFAVVGFPRAETIEDAGYLGAPVLDSDDRLFGLIFMAGTGEARFAFAHSSALVLSTFFTREKPEEGALLTLTIGREAYHLRRK